MDTKDEQSLRASTNAELLQKYVVADLNSEIDERHRTKFDGELKLKLVFRGGFLAELHMDDHKRLTGDMVRRTAKPTID